MKNILLLTACSLIMLAGCKYPTEFQTVNGNSKFTLALPPWMKEEKDLKSGADLQYANRYRNFYTIGEVIEKSNAPKPAAEIVAGNIGVVKKAMEKPVVTDSTAITANGVTGSRVEVYGKMQGENIYFTELLFEGKNRYYHISIWTRGEQRKKDHKENINKIVESFKEL